MEPAIEEEIAKLRARIKTLQKSEPEIMKTFDRDISALLDGKDCERVYNKIPLSTPEERKKAEKIAKELSNLCEQISQLKNLNEAI